MGDLIDLMCAEAALAYSPDYPWDEYPAKDKIECRRLMKAAVTPLARRHLEYWQAMPHEDGCESIRIAWVTWDQMAPARSVLVRDDTGLTCSCTIGRAIAELEGVMG